MNTISYIGFLITVILIIFGFFNKESMALAKVQMIWIWIIIAFNNGGMDYTDNEAIYVLSSGMEINFPQGGWLSNILAGISGRIGLFYWQYNSILCTIVLVIFFFIIKKYTNKVSFYISLFMIYPFAESVIQKRYFLMMMIAFIGVLAVSQKKYIKALVYFVFALGFHSSALMLYPIIIMDWIIEKCRWVFFATIFMEIYLLTFGRNILVGILGRYSSKFLDYYVGAHISVKASICFVIMNFAFILLILSISSGSESFTKIKITKNLDFVSRLNIFSLVYIPLLLADAVFFRNYRIVMLFNFLVLCQVTDVPKKTEGKKSICAIIYIGAMVCYVLIGSLLDKAGLVGPVETMFNHNQLLGLLPL